MKGFVRKDQRLSLCGLNCGLCPMRLGGHCGGCGAGNQSCKIARCSLEQGGVTYCYQCGNYPCEKYREPDPYDSFITGQNRLRDMEKARILGPEAYGREQEQKAELLQYLLTHYQDGRKKTLYCLAVSLLELPELRRALARAETFAEEERPARLAQALHEEAAARGILLQLRRKPASRDAKAKKTGGGNP